MKLKQVFTTVAVASLGSLLITPVAQGQVFTNLDFEAATVAPNASGFGWLDWATAAPGWNHSNGADTGSIYFQHPHLGTTQWYLLASATSFTPSLSEQYSLAFASGYNNSNDPDAAWVQAFVSQVGVVPVAARSLTLLATGPLQVLINDDVVPLVSLGGISYGVDISAFAGSVVNLKFQNSSSIIYDKVVIDDIAFSNISLVPEPSGGLLVGMGLLVVGAARRRCMTSRPR